MDAQKEFTYDKTSLRKILLQRRAALTDKPELSRIACERAAEFLFGNVMVYVPIGSELDTVWLIDRFARSNDVSLYVPHTVDGVIVPKKLLKIEPPDRIGNLPADCYGKTLIEGDKLDFCITPLVGFNDKGYRIGYGMGCYDRFFVNTQCKKIGLAFDCQSVSFLPDLYDVPLDCCVTEQNVIYFSV